MFSRRDKIRRNKFREIMRVKHNFGRCNFEAIKVAWLHEKDVGRQVTKETEERTAYNNFEIEWRKRRIGLNHILKRMHFTIEKNGEGLSEDVLHIKKIDIYYY